MSIQIRVDPLGAYPQAEQHQIIELCGMLLEWFLHKPKSEDLVSWMTKCYGFGDLIPMPPESSVDDKLRFCYPGDPPQAPLVTVDKDGETFIQWPHAVVSLNGFLTRMD